MTVTEMVGDLITGHLREKLRHQEPFERPVRARLARSGRGGPSRVARGVHLRCMTPDRTEIRAHTGLETLISIAALSEVIGVAGQDDQGLAHQGRGSGRLQPPRADRDRSGDAIEVTGRVVGGSSTLQDARDALVQVSQSAVLEFQVTVRDQELIVDITISTP
jgi:hypothetical protein